MDLEQKLKDLKQEIIAYGLTISNAKLALSEIKRKANEYQKLIDRAKELEKPNEDSKS